MTPQLHVGIVMGVSSVLREYASGHVFRSEAGTCEVTLRDEKQSRSIVIPAELNSLSNADQLARHASLGYNVH